MQKRIDRFNRFVMNTDLSTYSFGLYRGTMGLCIYFYELSRLLSDKKCGEFAKHLLAEITKRLSVHMNHPVESRLTEVCFAVNYLIENGYVKGNPNYILKDLDDKIIQSLLFRPGYMNASGLELKTINGLIDRLSYLTIRVRNAELGRNEKQIIQQVVIENMNLIEELEIDKFAEPAFFSITDYVMPRYLQLLQNVYKLGFYNDKIEKIVEGLSPGLLYRLPLNKMNCLFLCSAMKDLAVTFGNREDWGNYVEMQQRLLNMPQVIDEFRNKDLLFFNGLSGFYYVLRKTQHDRGCRDLFLAKIVQSEIWDSLSGDGHLLKMQMGLYEGLAGVILAYLHILHKNDSSLFFDYAVR